MYNIIGYLTMMSAGSADTEDLWGKLGRRPQANLDQSVPMRASTMTKRTIMAIMTEIKFMVLN